MPGRAASAGRKTGPRSAGSRRLRPARGDTRSEDSASAERAAFQRALRCLARRDQSSQELRRALERHGHTPWAVERTLERLSESRLIDDRAFAERFARRALSRGLGGKRIAMALNMRGVPRDVARNELARAQHDLPEAAVLDQLAQRYWRRNGRIERQRRLRRLWAFLLRRGFAAALIADRLRVLFPELDADLDALSSAPG